MVDLQNNSKGQRSQGGGADDKKRERERERMGLRAGTLAIPVSWRLDGGEVDCVGHLEVVAQSFIEHEFSTLKHHREYIYGGVKGRDSQQRWKCLSFLH